MASSKKCTERVTKALMTDGGGVEPDRMECQLHDRSGAEGAQKRPDPHRASEEPPDGGCRGEERNAHDADGYAPQAFRKPYEKRIRGPHPREASI